MKRITRIRYLCVTSEQREYYEDTAILDELDVAYGEIRRKRYAKFCFDAVRVALPTEGASVARRE